MVLKIFQCPGCKNTSDAVLCDFCYRNLLKCFIPVNDGARCTWFQLCKRWEKIIYSALERQEYWPAIVCAHMIYQYGNISGGFYTKGGLMWQENEILLKCFNELWQQPNKLPQIQIAWCEDDISTGTLNWVMLT
tara:strand:+ start:6109 stop:6510 length:402 start_codon:yes stop_codon:yes gene_type:complete